MIDLPLPAYRIASFMISLARALNLV